MGYSLQRRLLPAYQHHIRKLHKLNYIFFELTHRCNLTCLHCGSDCVSDTGLPDLPAEKVLEVLREIKKKHNSHTITVALSGGEPLVYPGIFELGKNIQALEFPWGMVTNGFAWDKAKLKQAEESGMLSVSVSLDGLQEDHDWLRGRKGSFKKATTAIRLLSNARFLQAMDVITCANQRNLDTLNDIADLLVGLGVTAWRIFTISPIGRAKEHEELFLSAEQYRQLLGKIRELRKRTDIRVTLSESGYLGSQHELKVRNQYFFCSAGISTAGVMINGDMLACPNIDRRFAQGNVFSDSFLDVWENKYQLFRDRRWMKKDRCAACKEWKYCQGGSFHLWSPDAATTKQCHFKDFELDLAE